MPHASRCRAITAIAAEWTSANFAPALAASIPACWASRTASYTSRWASLNRPPTGSVRVTSAV